MATVIGIDVGGTSIKAARFAADGTLEEQLALATPRDGSDIADAVRTVAVKLTTADLAAAGVAVPGLVDPETGAVRYSANLGWRDVPLRALVSADLGVPVAVGHDVTAAALAESEQRDRDLFYVALGTGIGGALVQQGTAVRGSLGMVAEIGHIPVYPDGETCTCGQRGCLECYSSAAGLARRYAAASGTTGSTAADLTTRLAADPIAAQVWQDATRALGLALATVALLLDPALVVLGGGLADAGQDLLQPVRAELSARLAWRRAPPLELAALGPAAGVRGAALLARRLISTPRPGKAGYPR
ncbi:MAG: ROK family protein [Jatrophihabitantaceae bacterium]